jgi:hypothetical protein
MARRTRATREVGGLVRYRWPSGTGASSAASWALGRNGGGEDEGRRVVASKAELRVTRTAATQSVTNHPRAAYEVTYLSMTTAGVWDAMLTVSEGLQLDWAEGMGGEARAGCAGLLVERVKAATCPGVFNVVA